MKPTRLADVKPGDVIVDADGERLRVTEFQDVTGVVFEDRSSFIALSDHLVDVVEPVLVPVDRELLWSLVRTLRAATPSSKTAAQLEQVINDYDALHPEDARIVITGDRWTASERTT